MRTNTGVDDSPTLNKSASSTRVTISPGDTIVLAGLDENSETYSKSGFLGGLLASRTKDKSTGQLLLVIQASVSADQKQGRTAVQYVTGGPPEPKTPKLDKLAPLGVYGDASNKGKTDAATSPPVQ